MNIIKIKRETVRRNLNRSNVFHRCIGPPEVTENILDDGTIVRNIRHNVETLYSLCPGPEFLYEYEDSDVTCEWCNKSFHVSKLYADEMCDGEDSYWNDKICPECHSWDCCEYSYETLTHEELRELAEKNK